MSEKTEWQVWSKQFETYEMNGTIIPAKCLASEIEGPHKVACLRLATYRSPDGYPVCEHHRNIKVRKDWAGFIKGAELRK